MRKLLLILPLFVLFSCASAPEKPQPEEEAVSAVQTAAVQATADREKARAVDAMNKAKSVKADVAVKDEYSKAMGVFNEAESLVSAGIDKIPAAQAKYLESEKLFLAAHDNTLVKREEALKQLEKAKQDIKNVEKEAEDFDREQAESEAGGDA